MNVRLIWGFVLHRYRRNSLTIGARVVPQALADLDSGAGGVARRSPAVTSRRTADNELRLLLLEGPVIRLCEKCFGQHFRRSHEKCSTIGQLALALQDERFDAASRT